MKHTKYQIPDTKYSLTIGWLYPGLMSTYGDRGNVTCLRKRSEWRNIRATVLPIELSTSAKALDSCDLVIGGGAQDKAQELVIGDLRERKKHTLKTMFDRGVPGLFVCGSPQLLGAYYTTAEGKRLEGLGIFDYYTIHPGADTPRCIGNTAGEILFNFQFSIFNSRKTIVGFENHGGRTYLGKNAQPFARVLKGNGNNGKDGYEGAVYKNVIACYYHGPFLPKNPHVADLLLLTALAVKYGKEIRLSPLDDAMEWTAHETMLRRLGL